MNVRTASLAGLSLAVFSSSVFAQQTIPTAPPDVLATPVAASTPTPGVYGPLSIVGSSGGIRYRNQHTNADALSVDQVQYNVDLRIALQLDKTGQWKIISRVSTGPHSCSHLMMPVLVASQ